MTNTTALKAAKAHLAAVEREVSAIRTKMGVNPLVSSWPIPSDLRARLYAAREAVTAADKAVGAAHRDAIRQRNAA